MVEFVVCSADQEARFSEKDPILFRDIHETISGQKVYIRADSLKEKMRRNIFPSGEFPEDTTFYVKNKKVKRQLRDMYGFQGKIIIKKKMKRYDKLK